MTDQNASHPANNSSWASSWAPTKDHINLNHGSFGRAPEPVLEAQFRWTRELQRNPMEFLAGRLDGLLDDACARMARFVGCKPGDLVFVPNATVAMNIVAANTPLSPGDEVLLNDHEYGAVLRIWKQRCQQTGATLVVARTPEPLQQHSDLTDALFSHVTERTRLIVVSHITSPTALIFPLAEIVARAHEKGIRVCVDGPHALAQLPLNLEMLGADYYCVSCHKWLCAPIGSGWLYVRGGLKNSLQPTTVSWGRSLAGRPATWKDEFHWPGTFDPACYLATTDAIEFLTRVGLDHFRTSTHEMVRTARIRCIDELGAEPISPDSPDWYGSLVTIRLPWVAPRSTSMAFAHPLQQELRERYRIEIPIVEWHGHVHIRISCHLYNTVEQIDRLMEALKELKQASA